MKSNWDTERFWAEEIRSFPHGGGGAAVWVVRRENSNPLAPLTVLFNWACGAARQEGMAERLPLSSLLKSMVEGREELVRKSRDTALWVEPLQVRGQVRGCLGIWFKADEPWRESIFLWAQRLGARLGPVMGEMEPLGNTVSAKLDQPTLFPVARFERPVKRPSAASQAQSGDPLAVVGAQRDPWAREILLPWPMPIPGIPGCIGVCQEMQELGRRLPDIARSGVNVLVRGESGTGKEIIASALHLASDRAKGPFVGQNCAALPEGAM